MERMGTTYHNYRRRKNTTPNKSQNDNDDYDDDPKQQQQQQQEPYLTIHRNDCYYHHHHHPSHETMSPNNDHYQHDIVIINDTNHNKNNKNKTLISLSPTPTKAMLPTILSSPSMSTPVRSPSFGFKQQQQQPRLFQSRSTTTKFRSFVSSICMLNYPTNKGRILFSFLVTLPCFALLFLFNSQIRHYQHHPYSALTSSTLLEPNTLIVDDNIQLSFFSSSHRHRTNTDVVLQRNQLLYNQNNQNHQQHPIQHHRYDPSAVYLDPFFLSSSTDGSDMMMMVSPTSHYSLFQYQPYRKQLQSIRNLLSPDYGELLIESLFLQETNNFVRDINVNDFNDYEQYRSRLFRKWENIYVSSKYDFYDDLDHPMECTRPEWTFAYYPNCPLFHEMVDRALAGTQTNTGYDVKYLAHGYYRDTWVFQSPTTVATTTSQEVYAVKHLRMRHDQETRQFEKIKNEALIMEQLTSSPVITNIYGHCGTSTVVEMAQELTYEIVPYIPKYMKSRGRMKQTVLDYLETYFHRPYPMNNFTNIEKLDIAIAMAEGIAEQHGCKYSAIANDDAHPDQWLKSYDGRYILNDMNNAVFLQWDFHHQRYCTYHSSYGGDFRAPEEYGRDGSYVDESVDIWPMGNLIFSLITGLWPYYTETDDEIIQNITMQGIRPYLNPQYRNRSFIERRLIEIMDLCHVLQPNQRVTVFQVLAHLYETKIIYEKTHNRQTN